MAGYGGSNNTTGGSWWKQAVEWGSDFLDTAVDWGSDLGSSSAPKPPSFLSPTTYSTGIGGRDITGVSGSNRIGTTDSSNSGWGWWDTAQKYAGYVDDYAIDPLKKVMGYGKDIYDVLPKGVQDAIMGKGKDPNDKPRPRAKAARAVADMSSTARQIGSSQPRKFTTQNPYNRNSPTGEVMYQAAKNEAIREAMLQSINSGSKTISLNQARDIYTHLSRRSL